MKDTFRNILEIKEFIESLLLRSGQVSLLRQRNFRIFKKGKKDGYITSVDIEIGKLIFSAISEKYPDDSIECEDGPHKKKGGNKYIWYIDPIDGTTNYIHKFPAYAICISYYNQETPSFLASGIYIPLYDQLFIAYGKKDAYFQRKKIKVSLQNQLKNSLVLSGLSFGIKKEENEMKAFVDISSVSAGTRRSGCAALDLCYVAAGFADAYYHYNLKPWDIAAGCHTIMNAGGKVSIIGDNNSFNLFHGTILATNGLIHSELQNKLVSYIKNN